MPFSVKPFLDLNLKVSFLHLYSPFFFNETEIEEFERKRIAVIKIGYQLLPRCFHDFFRDRNQTEARRIDSKQTRMDIKSKIAEYLEIPKLTDRPYVIMQMEC